MSPPGVARPRRRCRRLGCRRAGAAEFGRALSHRGQADAGAAVVAAGGDADAVVDDLKSQLCVLDGECHRGVPGSGVSRRVGQRLGGDAVGGYLDCGRQWRQGWRGHADVKCAAFAEPRGVGLHGRHQAELIQVGRPQVVDEPADASDRGPHFGLEFGQRHGRGLRVAGQGVAGRVEAEHDACQCGPEPVVQITTDTAALFLPRGHERFP